MYCNNNISYNLKNVTMNHILNEIICIVYEREVLNVSIRIKYYLEGTINRHFQFDKENTLTRRVIYANTETMKARVLVKVLWIFG